MAYDLSEHRHRFAVWAAARAAQRGFTSVGHLRQALEATDIRLLLANSKTLLVSSAEFDALHKKWCAEIKQCLARKNLDATYGRTAKLVAVYLKAAVILAGAFDTPLGRSAHPPIDRILLQALAASNEIKSPHQKEWREINWTELDEPEYWKLIGQLRSALPSDSPFWMLEKYWEPSKGDEVDDEKA
jgi:hypothetical protein